MLNSIDCTQVQIPGSVLKQKNSGQGYQCLHFSVPPLAIELDNAIVFRSAANVSYLVLQPDQTAIITLSHANSSAICLSLPSKWDYSTIMDSFQHKCCFPKDDVAERILGIIFDVLTKQKPIPDLSLSHLLVSFLYTLLGCSDYNTECLSKYIQGALSIIKNEYASPELTVSSVAQRLFISPPYLGKLFKEECGITFSGYLQNYRLEQARDRLLHTYELLNEIAFETGFVNASHFSTCFRKRYGMSPVQYRKKYKASPNSSQAAFLKL